MALAVMLTAVVFDVPEKMSAAAEESHSHKVCVGTAHDGCTHENIEFKPYPNDSDKAIVFRGDSFYLTEDIVLSGNSRFFVEKGVANLCLNGHSIKKDNGQIIDINNIDGQQAELNICDCQGTGTIKNTSDVSGYACVTVIDGTKFNLYSGNVDGGDNGCGIEICNSQSWTQNGGIVKIYGGKIQTNNNSAIWVRDKGCSLSIYGGEIKSENYFTLCTGNENEGENSTINIYGGKIIGSSDIYDTVRLQGKDSTVTINGGEVISDKFNAVDCWKGDLKITGGTIKAGGCAIWNSKNRNVRIEGGTIQAESKPENSYKSAIINYGSLKISGGNVTGNGSYAIQNYDNGSLEIEGGNIKGAGYALYNRKDGSAIIKGGNLSSTNGYYAVWNNGNLDISGGKINASYTPVTNHGTLNISSGEINTSYAPVENNATLNISGGSFGSENSATQTYIINKNLLNLSGSPSFINTSIWLQTDDNIGITGALDLSEPCAVYINSAMPRIFTSGWDTYMTNNNVSEYFKSPYNGAKIVYRDNEAAMVYYYKITYDANGGSCLVQSAETDSSDKLTRLTVPTREGYNFDGWFTEETGGEQVTTDTVFTNDTTIYAHWNEDENPNSGNILKEVQASANVPKPEIATSMENLIDAALTEEEQKKVNEGVDIKIILKVEDASVSVSDEDKERIDTAIGKLKNYKLGQYLDVTLLKKIGEQDHENITKTSKPITVTFEIPKNLRGKEEYSVIRIHGDETTVLEDMDDNENIVTIETDKFSTYALTYQEKASTSNTSGGSSGGNSRPSTSTPTESDNSDTTSDGDDNLSREDSADTTSGESKPTEGDNSDTTSSNDGNTTSSEDSNTTSSGEDSVLSEINTGNHDGNPSTGFAVSLIPLTTALVAIIAAVKHRKK